MAYAQKPGTAENSHVHFGTCELRAIHARSVKCHHIFGGPDPVSNRANSINQHETFRELNSIVYLRLIVVTVALGTVTTPPTHMLPRLFAQVFQIGQSTLESDVSFF
jgi:hypothetical protein